MVNIKDLFETKLSAALLTKIKEVREANCTFLCNITGPDGGSWLVDATSNGPSVSAVSTEDSVKANCTLTISSTDFKALINDPSKTMGMFFSGKLKVSGNQMLAMKLTKFLKA